jgi:hypothetical protein
VAIDLRRLRAAGLIGGALVGLAAVSFAYLRPPAPAVTAKPPAAAVPSQDIQPPPALIIAAINSPVPNVGDYFVWAPAGGGSGGNQP